VKVELERMKKAEVIEEITEPTDWCAPMVAVMKKTGAVRVCADLKKLNQAVKRERYMIPTIEDILHKLKGAKIFSKLDATSGFWQIPLDESTAKLTTFISPFGRYYYKRLPFGISSAPEIFQRTMEEILHGEQNVICFFDDTLIFSNTPEEHEVHLDSALKKLSDAGLKLNSEKTELRKEEIEFLGHRISSKGIQPDQAKVEAIRNMPDPTNVTELKRILGMLNFLGRFVPHMSSILRPATELLESDREWTWGKPQKDAMDKVKDSLLSAPALAFFDLNKKTTVSSDASSYGLGGVLLQEHDGEQRPVAFCSRTLTSSERGYAQIEKECLGAVWACEKFERYLVGLESFVLETDHKPLVPLINSKDLHDTPLRCQRLLIRLMRFNPCAIYTPGKFLVIADTLSRSPLSTEHEDAVIVLEEDVTAHINMIRTSWPASDRRLEEIACESSKDKILSAAMHHTVNGWPPSIGEVDPALREFFSVRRDLSVTDGLLCKGDRIVIPDNMRDDVLKRIHEGHFGIVKCRERAMSSVWWPGLSQAIAGMVQNCQFCQQNKPSQTKEPLLPTPLPGRPFQQVAADLCEVNGQQYLVAIDYYSRYLEISFLPRITADVVISKLKNIFAHHGVPETLVTDNGRQFTSSEFQEFARQWGFHHVTTSPYYPQANGEAERAVREAKKILSQKDPFLALLAHRSSTCSSTGASPAELAMGRKLRNTLPNLPANLKPTTRERESFAKRDEKKKLDNKRHFDRRHGARPLPELFPGTQVYQKLDNEKKWNSPATVLRRVDPRSYIIETSTGRVFRRNRRHLMPARFVPSFPSSTISRGQPGPSSPSPTGSAAQPGPSLIASPSPTGSRALSGPSPVTLRHPVGPLITMVPPADLPGTPRQPLPTTGATSNTIGPGTPNQSPPPLPRATRSGRIVNLPARYKD
jgi:hypothetical protein